MQKLMRVLKKLKNIHRFAKFSVKLGFSLMMVSYIIAFAIRIYAPYSPDYFRSMYLHRGLLEIAPAFLAVGVCAGLLGDLMLRTENSGNGSDSD